MRGENLVNHLFVVANEITTDQTRFVMRVTIYQFVGDQQHREQALELRAGHARIFRHRETSFSCESGAAMVFRFISEPAKLVFTPQPLIFLPGPHEI
jgi:hypothetical protein